MSIYILDSLSKQMYDQLMCAMNKHALEVAVHDTSSTDQIFQLYHKALSEHAYSYMYNPCRMHIVSGSRNSLSWEQCPEIKSYVSSCGKIEYQIDAIISLAAKETTLISKIRRVYRFFVDNFKYADDANDIRYHSAAAPFLYKEAVCEGFAFALALVLNRMGIPCGVISGKSNLYTKKEAHAWNVVKVNNRYYHMDVTWDICLKSAEETYSYFLLGDEECRLDHTWKDASIPPCIESFHKYEKADFCRTRQEWLQAVSGQLKVGKTEIKLQLEENLAKHALNKEVITEIFQRALKQTNLFYTSVSFSYNPDNGSLLYKVKS